MSTNQMQSVGDAPLTNEPLTNARTFNRTRDSLGGDEYGWAQLTAQSAEERREVRARNDTAVPRDLWEDFTGTVMEEAGRRLNAVQDLEDLGLTRDISFFDTIITWTVMDEMTPAERTMDLRERSELGDIGFNEVSVPVPVIQKDYDIQARKLGQLQRGAAGVSTAHARMASRVVTQSIEDLLINGWPDHGVEHRNAIAELYGYTTHPDRNTYSPSTVDTWSDVPTQATEDFNQMIGILEDERFEADEQGYLTYMAPDLYKSLRGDYAVGADAGDKILRDRIDDLPEIDEDGIRRNSYLDPGELVMVKPEPEVVELARDPAQIQNVEWESNAGYQNKYKVFGIYAPIVKSTKAGRSGIVHASGLNA